MLAIAASIRFEGEPAYGPVADRPMRAMRPGIPALRTIHENLSGAGPCGALSVVQLLKPLVIRSLVFSDVENGSGSRGNRCGMQPALVPAIAHVPDPTRN